MRTAMTTKRAAVKFGITGIRLRQRQPHRGHTVTGFVPVASPDGTHEALASLFGAENDVALLHTRGQQFPMVLCDRGTVSQNAGCAVYWGKGCDPKFFFLAMDFALDAGRMVQQQLSEITRLMRREHDVLVFDSAITQLLSVAAIGTVGLVLLPLLPVRQNVDYDLILLVASDFQETLDFIGHNQLSSLIRVSVSILSSSETAIASVPIGATLNRSEMEMEITPPASSISLHRAAFIITRHSSSSHCRLDRFEKVIASWPSPQRKASKVILSPRQACHQC